MTKCYWSSACYMFFHCYLWIFPQSFEKARVNTSALDYWAPVTPHLGCSLIWYMKPVEMIIPFFPAHGKILNRLVIALFGDSKSRLTGTISPYKLNFFLDSEQIWIFLYLRSKVIFYLESVANSLTSIIHSWAWYHSPLSFLKC